MAEDWKARAARTAPSEGPPNEPPPRRCSSFSNGPQITCIGTRRQGMAEEALDSPHVWMVTE